MSLYTLALFAHLVGVLSLFIGMGLQWTGILGFRRAQSISQMRLWSGLLRPVAMLGPLSAALILLAGGASHCGLGVILWREKEMRNDR